MFVKNVKYKLIDFDGFQKEPYCKLIANFIKLTGGYIYPMHVNVFGSAVGIKFGNGLIDFNEFIDSEHYKYFVEDSVDANLIDFVLPTKPLNTKRVNPLIDITDFPPYVFPPSPDWPGINRRRLVPQILCAA